MSYLTHGNDKKVVNNVNYTAKYSPSNRKNLEWLKTKGSLKKQENLSGREEISLKKLSQSTCKY
jgi:hypothetical protein